MRTCKHKNGELIEFMKASHTRLVEMGDVEKTGDNEIGEITHYCFNCYDCKKTFKVKNLLKAPRWFLKYHYTAYTTKT